MVDATTRGLDQTVAIKFAGIFRGAGHFGMAVDAGCGRTDIGCHAAHRIFLLDWICGVPAAACVKARITARRARSILNALWAKALGAAQQDIRGLAEGIAAGGLAAQRRLGVRIAPRLMRDAAKRQPRLFDDAAFDLERRGNRHQGEGVGQPVADFQVGVMRGEAAAREFDRR